MNLSFSKWVTSAAFSIQLSVAQIKLLKKISESGAIDPSSLHPMVMHAMRRRGLIESVGEYIALSRAGTLLAELINEAGIGDELLGLTTQADLAVRAAPAEHQAVALKASGMSNHEIAQKLNIKIESVQKALRRTASRNVEHSNN